MDSSMTIRSLRPLDLTEMYIAFLDSFSDYEVPFRLSKDQFVRKFVEKLKMNFSLSAGAFNNNALAGFIFSTINYYEGKLTAYNGGTGVRPAYRGRKIVHHIYDFLIPILLEKKVNQCVLEVLIQNERALKVYESIGFRKTKFFRCFKLEGHKAGFREAAISIEIFKVKLPDWNLYATFSDQSPSFLDSPLMINENLANEVIIEAHYKGTCIGYAIFQPGFGRISQMGVAPNKRGLGVGANIIKYILNTSKQKTLTVININKEASETIRFFENAGFENQINQYEMILSLQ